MLRRRARTEDHHTGSLASSGALVPVLRGRWFFWRALMPGPAIAPIICRSNVIRSDWAMWALRVKVREGRLRGPNGTVRFWFGLPGRTNQQDPTQ